MNNTDNIKENNSVDQQNNPGANQAQNSTPEENMLKPSDSDPMTSTYSSVVTLKSEEQNYGEYPTPQSGTNPVIVQNGSRKPPVWFYFLFLIIIIIFIIITLILLGTVFKNKNSEKEFIVSPTSTPMPVTVTPTAIASITPTPTIDPILIKLQQTGADDSFVSIEKDINDTDFESTKKLINEFDITPQTK